MQTVLQDLRYSLRQFVKSPGFTVTAVISLALSIGATTAVFSVIYAALINPYPYPAADRIVRLTVQHKAALGHFTWYRADVYVPLKLTQDPPTTRISIRWYCLKARG